MKYAHNHDSVIKWKDLPRWCPFVRGIHRLTVNSPDKGQWRGALMFSLICAWTNVWIHNRNASDLRRHSAHCEVTVMLCCFVWVFLLMRFIYLDPQDTIGGTRPVFCLPQVPIKYLRKISVNRLLPNHSKARTMGMIHGMYSTPIRT